MLISREYLKQNLVENELNEMYDIMNLCDLKDIDQWFFMLTFSTLATRVSWTTDFCKGELKKWNKAQQKMKHMLVLQWNLWARCRKNLLEISNTKSYHQQRIIIATICDYIIIIIIIIIIVIIIITIIITENSQNIPIQILRRRTRHNNKTYRIEIVNVKLKIHGFTLLVT